MVGKTLVLVFVALIFEAHTQNCNGGSFPVMSLSSLGLSPNIQVESTLGCQPPQVSSNGCTTSSRLRNFPSTQAVEPSYSTSDSNRLSCLSNTPSGPCGIEVGSSTSNLRGVLFPASTVTESSCLSATPSSSANAIRPQCGLFSPKNPSLVTETVCFANPRTKLPCLSNIQPSIPTNPCKCNSPSQQPTVIIDSSVANSLADSLQLLLLNDLIESTSNCQPVRDESTNNVGTVATAKSVSSSSSSAVATATSSAQSSNSNTIGSATSQISNPINLGLFNAPAINVGGGQSNVAISKASSVSVSGTSNPTNVEQCRGLLPNNCAGPNNMAITKVSGTINPFRSDNQNTCGCHNNLVNSMCPTLNSPEIRRPVNIETCCQPCRSRTSSCGNSNASEGVGSCNNLLTWSLNPCGEWTLNNPVRAPQTVGLTENCKPVLPKSSVPEPGPCSCNAIQPKSGLFSSVVNPIASSLNELSDFLTTVAPMVDIVSPMESNLCGYPEYIVPTTTSSYAVVDACKQQSCSKRPQQSQSSTVSVTESSSTSSSSGASSSTSSVAVSGNDHPISASISNAESIALTADSGEVSSSLTSAAATSSAVETVTSSPTAAISSASAASVVENVSSSKAEAISVVQDASPVCAATPIPRAKTNKISSNTCCDSGPIPLVIEVPSSICSCLPTSGYCSSLVASVEPLVYELQIPASIPAQLQCSFGC